MAKSKREQQRALFHVGGVFVFLTVVAIFFILGLGDSEEAVVQFEPQEGLNMDLPDPEDEYSSESKLEAVRKEQVRLDREKNQRLAQNTSFDMLNSLSAPKEEEKVAMSMDVEDLLAKIEDDPHPLVSQEVEEEKKPVRRGGKVAIKEADPIDDKMALLENEIEESKRSAAMMRIKYGMGSREDSLLLGLFRREESVPKSAVAAASTSATPAASNRRGFKSDCSAKSSMGEKDVAAVIHGDQHSVSNGGQIFIRLCQPLTLEGVVIPVGTVVVGTTSFGENRVNIDIDGIVFQGARYAFTGEVYGLDGAKGLYTERLSIHETVTEIGSDSYASDASFMTAIPNTVNRVIDKFDSWRKNSIKRAKIDFPSNQRIIIKMR